MKLLKIIFTIFLISLVFGCSNIKDIYKAKQSVKAYFDKGVYKVDSLDKKNPYKNYFYVFYNKNSGHTENSQNGIGLPFTCIQTNDSVKFKFGGSDEPEKIFKIKSVEDKTVTGTFDNSSLIIFTPLQNVDPDNFDAVEYLKNNN